MRKTPLQKPGKTAADAVLDTLKAAHPNGVKSTDLIEQHGPAARSRVTDLRNAGWDISTVEAGGVALYTLLSLVRGEPLVVYGGCVVRLDSRAGWTSRTHTEAQEGPVPASVLDEAKRDALAAYKAVLTRHGYGVAPPRVERLEAAPEEYEPPAGWTGDFVDDEDE